MTACIRKLTRKIHRTQELKKKKKQIGCQETKEKKTEEKTTITEKKTVSDRLGSNIGIKKNSSRYNNIPDTFEFDEQNDEKNSPSINTAAE